MKDASAAPREAAIDIQVKATAPDLDEQRVPHELQERRQWLVYRNEQIAGEKKPRKVPYYASGARRHGKQGSAHDREQLTSLRAAIDAVPAGGFAGLGFAFLPGDGLIGIDLDNVIDTETGEISERARKIIEACASYTEFSPSGKGAHIFVLGSVERSFKSNDIGVEVFCGAQFFTFTGRHYAGTPETLNTVGEPVIRRLRATVDQAKGKRRSAAGSAATAAPELSARSRVESALAALSSDLGYDEWLQIGMSIHAELGAGALDVWDYWSSKGAKYPGRKKLETHWKSFDNSGGITGATLFKLARNAGWRAPRTPRTPAQADPRNRADNAPPPPPIAPVLPPDYSEDKLARIYTRVHGAEWRYMSVWGKWLRFDRKWCIDEKLQHFDNARRVCHDAAKDVRQNSTNKNRDRIAALIESARTVAAVVKLASADPVHAAEIAEWDSDPWVLNTPGGLVDLKTGAIGPHRRDAYCTKMTAANPDRACRPRHWVRFLYRVTGNDRRVVAYLQRLMGLCLTGITREHFLAFLWGLGANGKSTFLNTITGLLGDYAEVASMETFVESRNDQHPTDLARLRGARLVTAQETEEGKRWAASRIKALTGGDPITARFMRQDFFTFTPAFKLILAGNHKPALRNVDEAMRRRLHLVPFTQCIPAAERDQRLMEKLRAEWPGILAWAIRGCLRWQRLGLRPPAAVREATDLYLQDEDVLEAWLGECVTREGSAFAGAKQLHASYQAWAERSGERFYGMKRFGQLLEERGFERIRTSKANGFRGLMLPQAEPQMELIK